MKRLFVQYLKNQSVLIDTNDCEFVADFIEKIQNKYASYNFASIDKLTLHRNDKSIIESGLELSELVNDPDFINSGTVPLLIRYAGQVDEESAEDRASKKRKTGMFI